MWASQFATHGDFHMILTQVFYMRDFHIRLSRAFIRFFSHKLSHDFHEDDDFMGFFSYKLSRTQKFLGTMYIKKP
jgi:hypothetical protein